MSEGDPVWVVIIGGSSRGKTELLMALDGLPRIRIIGALTAAAMLSGTSRKDKAKTATGGILRELGDQGVIVVEDLGAILVLHRDARGQVLQALRDVYDGRYTRDVGVDGGVKLDWTGKVGTRRRRGVRARPRSRRPLGARERWITVRLPDGGEDEMVRFSLGSSDTATVRSELRDVVRGFLAGVGGTGSRPGDACARLVLRTADWLQRPFQVNIACALDYLHLLSFAWKVEAE